MDDCLHYLFYRSLQKLAKWLVPLPLVPTCLQLHIDARIVSIKWKCILLLWLDYIWCFLCLQQWFSNLSPSKSPGELTKGLVLPSFSSTRLLPVSDAVGGGQGQRIYISNEFPVDADGLETTLWKPLPWRTMCFKLLPKLSQPISNFIFLPSHEILTQCSSQSNYLQHFQHAKYLLIGYVCSCCFLCLEYSSFLSTIASFSFESLPTHNHSLAILPSSHHLGKINYCFLWAPIALSLYLLISHSIT